MSLGDLVANSTATDSTGAGSLTLTPAYTPTGGNTRKLKVWNHGESVAFTPPVGWTEHPLSPIVVPNTGGAGISTGLMAFYYRVVEDGDSATVVLGSISNQVRAWVSEFEGTGVLSDSDTASSAGTSGPPRANPLGTVSVSGTTVTVGLGIWSNGGDPGWAFSTDVGTIGGSGSNDGSHGPPYAWIYHKTTTTTTVSPTITLTNGAANGVAGLLAAFSYTSVPTPGMWAAFHGLPFRDTGAASTDPKLVRLFPQASSSPISDNITDDVISVQIDRQADVSGGSPTGTMTVITKNTDGKFNPDNAASPYAGLLNPGMPFWFGCNADLTLETLGQAVYGRFAGYLKTLAPIPEPGATDAPTVQWIVEDPMARYRTGKARVAFSSTRTVKTYRQALLTAIGETRVDLDTESDTLPATGELGIGHSWVSSRHLLDLLTKQIPKRALTFVLNVLEDLNRLVGTRHFINPADTKEDWYAYTTRNRQAGLGDAAVAALTAMVTDTQGYVHSSDGIENTISVEVRPFRVASQASEVWSYGELPFPIHTGHSKTILADFGDQVFDATVVLGSTAGNATATMVSYGTGAVILITTVGGDTVTHLSIDGRPVTRLDSFAVERSDAGSKLAYGEMQGEDVSSDLMTSSGLAEGIAEYRLWANAAPRKTPSVTIINHPDTLLPLDLFDVVTLTIPQLDVTAKRFEIIGIHETWSNAAVTDDGPMVLVVFRLDLRQTPNASVLPLLTFDSSLFGGADGFAP